MRMIMCQVVVFNVDDRPVPIVHRIIRVHEKEDRSIDVLTKVQPSHDSRVPQHSNFQFLSHEAAPHCVSLCRRLRPTDWWLCSLHDARELASQIGCYVLVGRQQPGRRQAAVRGGPEVAQPKTHHGAGGRVRPSLCVGSGTASTCGSGESGARAYQHTLIVVKHTLSDTCAHLLLSLERQ